MATKLSLILKDDKYSMSRLISLLCIAALAASCTEQIADRLIPTVNWAQREVPVPDSLESGTTYLSIYSQIYSEKEKRTHDLTVTVSIRNTDHDQRIYLTGASLYDSKGEKIKNYLSSPAYIDPMETVEIIIDEKDKSGGTGGNFLFHWQKEASANAPLFEAVMISTVGQQGLSFTTTGVDLTD